MNITIVAADSGQSESLPVTATTKVNELAEWASALLGIANPVLLKDQRPIADANLTLQQVGIQDGDLIMVSTKQTEGLDFSNLLGSTSTSNAAATGLDFSNLLGGNSSNNTNPVYYPGMSLHEAQSYNRHPRALCQVLMEHEHLRKELNYYNPQLVASMFPPGGTVDHAAKIWRETMIKVPYEV